MHPTAPLTAEEAKRRAIWPGSGPTPTVPYSPVVTAGGWVFVAGQFASDPTAGGMPDEARVDPDSPYFGNELEAESRCIFPNMEVALEAADVGLSDVVWLSEWFALDCASELSIAPYLRTRAEFMKGREPASAATGIRRLCSTEAHVELDMTALHPSLGTIQRFGTDERSGAACAVRRGDWVFLASQDGIETSAGSDAGGPVSWNESSTELQTERALERLAAAAEAAGSRLDRCVRATIYLAHPSDWHPMEQVWRGSFPTAPPARLVIPYMGLGTTGSRIAISMELVAADSSLDVETVQTSHAPEPVGHEPQAVKAGEFVFFSTQAPIDSSGRVPKELLPQEGFPYYRLPSKLQMAFVLDNVSAICEAAGTSLDQICRRKVFHDDLAFFASSMEEWGGRFPVEPPASTAVDLGGPALVPGAHFSLDLIAYVPRED